MIKRCLSLLLALVLCLGLVPTAALAAQGDVKQFKDWDEKAWWATSGGVRYAVGMGYIVGREGPTVAPYANVTEAEFVTVLVRACLSAEDIAKYKAQALQEYMDDAKIDASINGAAIPTDAELQYEFEHGGVNWYIASGVYHAASDLGLVYGAMNPESAVTDTCTRAQMASLLVRAMHIRGEDTSKIDTGKAMGKMNDRAQYAFKSGKYSGYGEDIGIAIGAGLIVGDESQKFNPGNTMTRSEMAEVLLRLDNPKINGVYPRDTALARLNLQDGGSLESDTPTTPLQSEAPITIDMRTPNVPHRAPKEGDTIIRPDGTSVVLARDAQTGVLGYGQNVGPYLGTQSKETGHIMDGSEWILSSVANGEWTDELAGGWYIQSPIKGQEYTYHWSSEWSAIWNKTNPDKQGIKGVDGQVDSTGLWMYFADDGQWIWLGPNNI